jgi:hypothetical protein
MATVSPRLVKRKEIVLFLDTVPNTETWGLYGKKTTTATYTYNPSTTSETYIVDDNATVNIDSYNISIDGNMKCYFGDAIYDYINTLRYNLAVGDEAKTQALLVDKYDTTDGSTFKAQVFECTIAIGSYGGDGGVTPTITFTINLNGTPRKGTVTMSGSTPEFTETVTE